MDGDEDEDNDKEDEEGNPLSYLFEPLDWQIVSSLFTYPHSIGLRHFSL
jgi:hypothetical protein